MDCGWTPTLIKDPVGHVQLSITHHLVALNLNSNVHPSKSTVVHDGHYNCVYYCNYFYKHTLTLIMHTKAHNL